MQGKRAPEEAKIQRLGKLTKLEKRLSRSLLKSLHFNRQLLTSNVAWKESSRSRSKLIAKLIHIPSETSTTTQLSVLEDPDRGRPQDPRLCSSPSPCRPTPFDATRTSIRHPLHPPPPRPDQTSSVDIRVVRVTPAGPHGVRRSHPQRRITLLLSSRTSNRTGNLETSRKYSLGLRLDLCSVSRLRRCTTTEPTSHSSMMRVTARGARLASQISQIQSRK